MAFRTVHPAWLDQTSSSSSIDSSSTPWKSASGNSCKSLIPIQRSDRKLWPFEPSMKPGSTRAHHHRVSIPHPLHGKGHPETPVKVRSRSNSRIESYGLSNRPSSLAGPDLIIIEYRYLIHSMEQCIRKLQKKFDRDQTVGSKVMAFRTVHPAWLDQISSSPSIDSSSTPWKSASGNSSKSLIPIQWSDQKLWPFEPSIKPGWTRPHHHQVSIPHPLHGKVHPETPVKV